MENLSVNPENYKILVVDDIATNVLLLKTILGKAGYRIVTATGGREALEKVESESPDLILLDIMMPGMDGFALCRWIREQSSEIGIIMLSAKSQEMDKVNCLMIGAHDYVTKPFSPSELVARVDAISRRVTVTQARQDTVKNIISGPFTLDYQSRTVQKNGEPIELTQVEYHIMEYLLKNRGTALDRKTILHHIWGEAYYGDDKVVDVNIRRLRMKIEDDPSDPQYIQTIWGFGYKWNG